MASFFTTHMGNLHTSSADADIDEHKPVEGETPEIPVEDKHEEKQVYSVEINNSTNIANPSSCKVSKPKRRCLRLDLGHNRDVFITTFYRIWMYRRRHVMTTILQLLIPPMILVGMTVYLGTLLNTEKKGWSHYDSLNETQLQNKICGKACKNGAKGLIACYMENKNTKFSREFTHDLENRLSKLNVELKVVDKKDDLLTTAIRQYLHGDDANYIAGIEVQNPGADKSNSTFGIGDNLILRFTVAMAHKAPGFHFGRSAVFFDLQRNNPTHYYQFLAIELAVCRTFYEIVKAETGTAIVAKPISIDIKSLSYPPYWSHTLKSIPKDVVDQHEIESNQGIDSMLAAIFVLSMIPAFYTVVEGPVLEKESGFKLYLQLMGYPRGAYWFHWILNQMLVQFIVIGIQVYLIFTSFSNAGILVKNGSVSLWIILLSLYNLASLSFFAFIAAFCRTGKMATYIGTLIWLLSYHMLESNVFDFNSSLSVFMLTCLLPSGCIHWAVYILTTVNATTWGIIANFSLTQKSGFTLAHVMLMMVANFLIYFCLTLYADNLSPGPSELGQPWNYFFENIRCRFIDPVKDLIGKTPQASRIEKRRKKKDKRYSKSSTTNPDPVIEFQKLSKKFYLIDGIYGIENVQFTVFKGITVLLGHRDSGRTTLFRLVCGAYAPTSGTLTVFNYNVRTHSQKVQSFLNVCMESDMLCDYLTVMEHMWLIAKLKGVRGKDTKEEIKSILDSLGLLSQGDDMMYRLARWQRRVLCVAMALIGDVPILLLDEPTVSLELDAKRQIWNLLKELKAEGKTIVMSTQDIDEAYQVADRIVIFSRGRVAGVGSPSKLENIFETGYHLTLGAIPDANPDEILTFIKDHVPGAREREGSLKRVDQALHCNNWENLSQSNIMSIGGCKTKSKTIINMPVESVVEVATTTDQPLKTSSKNELGGSSLLDIEISYLLPTRDRASFPGLFKALDDGKSSLKLGIKHYDMILHSMEKAFNEIDDYVGFLEAGDSKSGLRLEEFLGKKTKALRLLEDEPTIPMPEHQFFRGIGCCSCWSGVTAVIINRIAHAIGNYRHALAQILTPVTILLIAINSTNRYFSHDLMSPPIYYNTSLQLITPLLPYKIAKNSPNAERFFESYRKVIGNTPNNMKRFNNIGTSDFSYYYDEDHIYKLHDEVLVAADFTQVDDKSKVTALFSPGHQHSAPLSLLVMFNALLDYEMPKERKYTINMAGCAMSHSQQHAFLLNSTFPDTIITFGAEITLTVALAFGLFIFAAGFVTQPCAERLCRLKRYQMYYLEWNGLYWIANSIIDLFINVLQIILLTLVIYYAPEHYVFRNPEFIILFVITGTLGGFSSIIGSYCWSHYWEKNATSYYATLSVNQFVGLFLFLFYTIINFKYFYSYVGPSVTFCLQCFQPFTVPWNFYIAILWATYNGRCRALNPLVKEELCSSKSDNIENITRLRDGCCDKQGDWSFNFLWNNQLKNITVTPLWSNVASLFAHCVGGILLLMYMERGRMRRSLLYLLSKPHTPPAIINPKNAESIKKEEIFIMEELLTLDVQHRNNIFCVEGLSTSAGSYNLLHPMSFVVELGKPLVIVGPETAGITVLYEILAGLRAISEGNVLHGGYALFSGGTRRKFLQQLGLCPSEDITVDKLTGSQLLTCFARLRGIPSESLENHVNYWVKRLDLQTKIKKQAISYSVAFKKKLSVALAVIGNPPVLIFEEPTRDLDPLSKSQVLKVITSLCADRIVIILTHDLASVQDVCSKLIILVNGQMQLCEKTENIYQEIAEEFKLTIKLKGDENGSIDLKAFHAFVNQIETEIKSMTLQEEQPYQLQYKVKNLKYNWANLFETVENVCSKHPVIISDYHLQKASLEDVYNTYAGKQRIFRSQESGWRKFRSTYC